METKQKNPKIKKNNQEKTKIFNSQIREKKDALWDK